MDPKLLEANYLLEDCHWWFLGRRKIVKNLIERFYKKPDAALALDAGCGTGIMLDDLKPYAQPVGIDYLREAVVYTKRRGHKNILVGNICSMPFRDGVFDIVTALGVLQSKNIPNEKLALGELFRVLKKGGLFILDEAAYNALLSKHNFEVDGIRRYRCSEMASKIKECGFKILKASYWNAMMLPIFYLIVKLQRINIFRERYNQLSMPPRFLNRILACYLYLEAFLIRYIDIVFGHSFIIIAEK